MVSLGGGNWRCAVFYRAAGVAAVGPATTTDNTVPRFNGTAGALQTSGLTISDTDDLAVGGTVIAQATSVQKRVSIRTRQALRTLVPTPMAARCASGQMASHSARIQTSFSTAGDMAVAGDIAANSDAVLKYDVEALDEDEALAMVLEINARRYRRYSDERLHIGFIANDFDDRRPELVTFDEEGIRSLNYTAAEPCCGRRSRRW